MELLDSYKSKYCTECKTVCHIYEQGLCCDCDQPWETEVLDPKEYPSKWVDVQIEVRRG